MDHTVLTYDPYTIPPIGHNQPPADPVETALQNIQDLFDEAKNFCDGEPIGSQDMHDTIEKLYDGLHAAGKVADELRIEAKRPHDEAAAAIQAIFNPYVQPKKGKVDLGKAELGKLLAVWRKRVADEKAETARLARVEADRKIAEAAAAIQSSSGNLAAREEAEELLKEAKAVDRFAKRADKAATTGTGLRTVWRCELQDIEAALDHYYPIAKSAFQQLVEELARVDVQIGKRAIPGFRVYEEKVAI